MNAEATDTDSPASAAAAWPEEPYVQGRIDGHPGVALRDPEALRAAPLDTKEFNPQKRKGRLSYSQPGDISNWPKS